MSDAQPTWKPVSWPKDLPSPGLRKTSWLDKPLPDIPSAQKESISFIRALQSAFVWSPGCCAALAPRRASSLRRHKVAKSTQPSKWSPKPAPRGSISQGAQKGLLGSPNKEAPFKSPPPTASPEQDLPFLSTHESSHSLGRSRRHEFPSESDSIDAAQEPHQRRAKPRPFRSLLSSNSPSSAHTRTGNSSDHSGSPPGFSPSLLNVDLVSPRHVGDPDSRPDDSIGTVATYASHYSDHSTKPPVPPVALDKAMLVPGIAVTQHGITRNPLVARRAISDSTTMAPDLHPVRLQPGSPPQGVVNDPKSRPKSSRRRGSVPHLSGLRQEVKESLSDPESAVEAAGPDLRTMDRDELPVVSPMAEWGKLDAPMFRRPVGGYFELPGTVNVNDPPDHLQNSRLCPLHPRHHFGQGSCCPIHGRREPRRTSSSYTAASNLSAVSRRSEDAQAEAPGAATRPPSPGSVTYWNQTRNRDDEHWRPPLAHKPVSSPARGSGFHKPDRASPGGPLPLQRLVFQGLERRSPSGSGVGRHPRRRERSDRSGTFDDTSGGDVSSDARGKGNE